MEEEASDGWSSPGATCCPFIKSYECVCLCVCVKPFRIDLVLLDVQCVLTKVRSSCVLRGHFSSQFVLVWKDLQPPSCHHEVS